MKRININNYLDKLDKKVIILEPRKIFDRGVVGFTKDYKHIIYDIELLIDAIAESFTSSEIPESDALEYIESSVVGPLSYMDSEYRPILMTNGEF